MQRNKLILLIGDVIIPILGYFFWNWNVYFIFLFLFLDLISYNILYYYKHRKIQRFRDTSINKALFTLHASSLVITTTLLFVGYTYLFNSIQSTSYTTEIAEAGQRPRMGQDDGRSDAAALRALRPLDPKR